tara:strand:- start:10111 stop:14364 length:4254 start_codon:yes stop_codon:yes gene_type:complete
MYGITSAPVSRAYKYAGNALRMMGSPELLDSEKIRQLGRQATYRSREIQESVPETKTARTAQGIGEFGTTGLEYMGGGGAARGLLTGAVRRGVGAYASRGLGDKVAKSLARVATPVLKPQTRLGTVLSDMALYSPADIAYAASGDPGVGGLLGMMGAEGLSEWLGESKVKTGLADVLFGGVADATLRGIGAAYRRGQGPTPSAPSSLLTSSDVLPREPGTIIKGVSPHQPLSRPEARRLLTGTEPRPLLTAPTEPAGLLEAPVKPKAVKDAVIRQTPSQWGVERPEMQSALEPYPYQPLEYPESYLAALVESPLAGNYTSPVMRAVQGGPKSATIEGWEDYLTRQKGLKRDEVDLVLSALPYHKSGPTPWPRYRTIPREIVEDSIKDMYGGLKVVEADARMLGGALGAHMRDVKPLERYMDELREAKGLGWTSFPGTKEEAVRLEAEHLRQADLDRMRNNLRESSDEYSISIGNQSKGWLNEGWEPFTPYAFEITSDLPGIRDFDESHFGNLGAIAHVRFRRTPQGVGKRRADGLHQSSIVVDEIQSDAYQRFRQAAIHKNYLDRLKEEAGRRFADEAQWGLGDLKKVERDVSLKWLEEAGLGKNPQLTRKNKDKLRQHVWKNTPQEVRRSVEDIVAQRSFGVDAAQLPFRQTEQWLRVAVSEILKRAAQNGIREVVFPTGTQINRVYQGESTNPGGMYDTVLQTVIKQVSKDLGATVKRMDLDQAEKYLPSDMADPPQGLLAGKHGPDIGADPDPNTVVEISEDLGSRMRGEQPHRPVSTKMYSGGAGLLGATIEDDDPDKFGWRDLLSYGLMGGGAAKYGMAAGVIPAAAGKTAIKRPVGKGSVPTMKAIAIGFIKEGDVVLHSASGIDMPGADAIADAVGKKGIVINHDPYTPNVEKMQAELVKRPYVRVTDNTKEAYAPTYDKIISSYAWNVITKEADRNMYGRQLAGALSDDGQLMISTRKDIKESSDTQVAMSMKQFRQELEDAGLRVVKEVPGTGAHTVIAERIEPVYPTRDTNLGIEYEATGPPQWKVDPKKKDTYLSKVLTPEADQLAYRRAQIMADMEAENWEPFFDVEERFDVDPSKYTIEGDVPRPQRKDTLEKYMKMYYEPSAPREILKAGFEQAKNDPLGSMWYGMGQLEAEYIKELGAVEGRRRFDEDFATAMAATTGGADPTANLLSAAYGNFLRERGMQTPATYDMPYPIGGRYIGGNIEQHRRALPHGPMRETGGLLASQAPKRFNFRANFLGDLSRATIDEQMMKAFDPMVQMLWNHLQDIPPRQRLEQIDELLRPMKETKLPELKRELTAELFGGKWPTRKNAPEKPAYGIIEDVVAEVARALDMSPREFQGITWGGLKGTEGKPMISHVNEAIERTSRITGRSPAEVMRALIRREPLYGMMGLLGAGAMANERESN